MERYIAIDNYCAWPNIKRLPNGELVAFVFNKPGHGTYEGEVECWASADAGRLWTYRGTPAPHDPGANRMNHAAGLTPGGSLLALVSGWSNPTRPVAERQVISMRVCRSEDHGATWTQAETLAPPPECVAIIPFGDILTLPGGRLGVTAYSWNSKHNSSWFYTSDDDGRTWGHPVCIGADNFNETVALRLASGRLIAAARTTDDGHLDLFVSEDDGASWTLHGPLTMPAQHPGALTTLRDGRLLLTFGVRCYGFYGVATRVGSPDGLTWGRPIFLAHCEGAGDGGYPSSLQLDDGTLVTAYYANRDRTHTRYHMGVVRWTLEEVGASV